MKSINRIFYFIALISQCVFSGSFTVNNVTQFQSALNSCASNGQSDTINVLAGTYNVNPSLTFISNENYSLFIRGTGSPVLDGANLRQVLQLTANSPAADIIIEGLTIQHGKADYGGGLNILTQEADIIVRNCSINDNTSNYVAGGVNLFSNTGSVSVSSCSFSRNSSPNTSGYPYGNAGGLFIQTDGSGTTITLSGCTFTQNTSQRDAAGAMLYPLGSNSSVIAELNTFVSNTAKESGGGCWIRCPGGNSAVRYRSNVMNGNSCTIGGNGAGTYIQITSGSIELYDNQFTGNNSVWQGGGLWVEHSGGTMNVYRNRFINNTAGETGAGANLFLDYGTAKIYHNIFNRNRSVLAGGGINFSTNTGSINIFNNTLFSNTASDGGDVNLYFDNSSARSYFINNILYKSTEPALSYSGQQTVTARYCDIMGGTGQPWFGTGCFDRYPYFRDTTGGDFHLQDSVHCGNPRYSPCIDAGNPDITDSIINCSWGLNLARTDMGAYGGKGNIPIGIHTVNTIIPEQFTLYQNYPNPFNPVTKINFSVPVAAFVKLAVYDILGREITVLVNEALLPGIYNVNWNADKYSSGIYYYKLGSFSFTETTKMVLIK